MWSIVKYLYFYYAKNSEFFGGVLYALLYPPLFQNTARQQLIITVTLKRPLKKVKKN